MVLPPPEVKKLQAKPARRNWYFFRGSPFAMVDPYVKDAFLG
jgi:hypothetical protein